MSYNKPRDEVLLSRAKELLNYCPETGVFTWKVRRRYGVNAGDVAGYKNPRGYTTLTIDNGCYRAHRVAWAMHYGTWPTLELDHIDGNRSNNCIANLREVSRSTNGQNQRKPMAKGSSGFLGVSYSKECQKYRAGIYVNKKTISLGFFSTAEQAHAAYVNAKRQLHEGNTL